VLLALRSLVVSVLFVALWAWIASTVRVYDARLPLAIPEALRPLGAVLVLLGACLAIACIVTFAARGRGTPAPFDPPRELVAAGPYRVVRNPMYLAAAAAIAGAGIFLRSPAIALLALVFLLVFHLFVLLYEEPALRRGFGESYVRYSGTVNRWMPRLRPRTLVLLLLVGAGLFLLAGFLLGSPGTYLDDTF